MPSVKEKEHTFKEKIVGSVPAVTKTELTGTVSFKKSKFNKSNCRKRLDDNWRLRELIVNYKVLSFTWYIIIILYYSPLCVGINFIWWVVFVFIIIFYYIFFLYISIKKISSINDLQHCCILYVPVHCISQNVWFFYWCIEGLE